MIFLNTYSNITFKYFNKDNTTYNNVKINDDFNVKCNKK